MAMEVIHDGDDAPGSRASAVSIGVFDGVHRGHRELVNRIRREAAVGDLASGVITFDRHPALVTRPDLAPKLLTSLDHKLELLEQLGLDFVYLVEFTPERAKTSAVDFFRDVFVERVRAASVTVGRDFHFGRGRTGDVAMMQREGAPYGIAVSGVELVPRAGQGAAVSSTAIRAALAAGDIEQATEMLGRLFEIRGPVIEGDQRGRTIGFPTANVPVPTNMAWPAESVYAGWYLRPDGTRHPAAINIGRRPTFYDDAEQSLLEAHVIDFAGDLYGEEARVQFVTRLRGEQKFDGIEALRAQLEHDIAAARSALA